MIEKIKKIIEKIDNKGIDLLNHKQVKYITYFMKFISELFDTIGFGIISSIFILILIYSDIELRKPLLLLTISQLLTYVFKRIFGRNRPFVSLDWVNLITKPPKDVFSFPSGHTTAAFSLAYAVRFSFPQFYFAFFILAILCGVSRVYLGVHYPSDVFIGAIIPTIVFHIISMNLI